MSFAPSLFPEQLQTLRSLAFCMCFCPCCCTSGKWWSWSWTSMVVAKSICRLQWPELVKMFCIFGLQYETSYGLLGGFVLCRWLYTMEWYTHTYIIHISYPWLVSLYIKRNMFVLLSLPFVVKTLRVTYLSEDFNFRFLFIFSFGKPSKMPGSQSLLRASV